MIGIWEEGLAESINLIFRKPRDQPYSVQTISATADVMKIQIVPGFAYVINVHDLYKNDCRLPLYFLEMDIPAFYAEVTQPIVNESELERCNCEILQDFS